MRFSLGEVRELIREAFGDAYKILGVPKDASQDQIKSAYRKLAITLHPDRNKDPSAGREMVKANAAWTILSDPQKRSRYDMMGDKTVDTFDGSSSGPAPRAPSPGASPRGGAPSDFWDDFFRNSRWNPSPRPRPSPSPGPTSGPSPKSSYQPPPNPGPAKTKRYFVYDDPSAGQRGSHKFWWVEYPPGASSATFGFGRVGTPGKVYTKNYRGSWSAQRAVRNAIIQKVRKGYKETSAPPAGHQQHTGSPAPRPARQPGAPTPGKQKTAADGKKLYKLYPNGPPGDRRGSRLHTGFRGKFYKSPSDTKFRPNDRADVSMGDDGKVRVKNPDTGHTQTWGESLELLSDFLFEVLQTIDE